MVAEHKNRVKQSKGDMIFTGFVYIILIMIGIINPFLLILILSIFIYIQS